MNEVTRNVLKVCVERCVRTVRASNRRKDRMRAELFAHLAETYDRELARTACAEDALEQTLRRFGDVGTIHKELQASVPWLERWLFFPVIGSNSRLRRRADESQLRYELRLGRYVMVMFGAFITIVILGRGLVNGWHFRSPTAIPGLLSSVALVIIGTPMYISITHAKRNTIRAGGSARPLWSLAVSMVAVLAGIGYATGFIAIMNWTAGVSFLSLSNPWVILPAALIAPLVVEIQARGSIPDVRRFEEWGSLDVDAA